MVERKRDSPDSVAKRLRRYQMSQGLPWRRVAERLGISISMVMMVLRGERNLSSKALFRFEEAEREVLCNKSCAEEIVESLVGNRDVVAQILGQSRRGDEEIEVEVDYAAVKTTAKLPSTIRLAKPTEGQCRQLIALFRETLDTRLIVLACFPHALRTESFLSLLTDESRVRLTNVALGLVIPDWRTLVLRAGMRRKQDEE